MSGSALLTNVGAGVYNQEVNASFQAQGISTTIGVMVSAFKKGPIAPTYVTSPDQFTKLYGQIDTSWSYGHISALAFLNYANRLLVSRVADLNTCSYAALDVFNGSNALGNANYTFLAPASNVFLPLSGASSAALNEMLVYSLYLSAPLASGSSISGSITVPNTAQTSATIVTLPTISFSTSSDATMVALANAISLAFNSNGVSATATAVNATNSSTCSTIQILMNDTPANQYSTISTITVAGSSSTITQQNNDLFQIFATGPGSDGNNVAVQITNANTAAPPQISISTTLTSAADALSIVGNFAVNGKNYSITATGTSAALAVQNFISDFSTELGGIASGIYSLNGLQLTIILYAPAYGATFTPQGSGFVITDTATTPVILNSTTVVNANASYNNFTVNVYYKSVIRPVETFVCSLNKQVDGFGRQQLITSVINGTTNQVGSNYINVVYTGAGKNPSQNVSPTFVSGTTSVTSTPIVFLGGGQDGIQPDDADVVTAINGLASTEAYKFNLLINNGYTDVSVQQALENLAATRQDSFAILDMPAGLQSVSAAVNYVSNTLGINSSYAAIYTPNFNILNTVTNEIIPVPPSGYIAGQYAYNDQNFAVWLSPAGLKRGVIPNVISLTEKYDAGDRALLASANINPIKAARNGQGNVIWDVWTLSQPQSLLSFVSVRRLFIFLEQSILTVLESDLFDNIDSQLEFLVVQAINGFLQPIKDANGIQNFYVLSSSVNNPASVNDAGQLNVTVYIVPFAPARIISLTTVVTPSTVSFQELITNGII